MEKEKGKKSFIAVIILLFLFLISIYKTVWGATYLFKCLTYDHYSWGEIIYISDHIRHGRPYPDHINMQMTLDEPVNGKSTYSITFSKHIHARDDNIDFKGERALAVYNNFDNSDGDIITKWDIITSVAGAVVFAVFVTVISIFINKIKKDIN